MWPPPGSAQSQSLFAGQSCRSSAKAVRTVSGSGGSRAKATMRCNEFNCCSRPVMERTVYDRDLVANMAELMARPASAPPLPRPDSSPLPSTDEAPSTAATAAAPTMPEPTSSRRTESQRLAASHEYLNAHLHAINGKRTATRV